MPHYTEPLTIDDGLDRYQPSPEEEAEASFYFFIQEFNHYAQSGKFGPRIWDSISEETRSIIRNQVVFKDVGPKFQEVLARTMSNGNSV